MAGLTHLKATVLLLRLCGFYPPNPESPKFKQFLYSFWSFMMMKSEFDLEIHGEFMIHIATYLGLIIIAFLFHLKLVKFVQLVGSINQDFLMETEHTFENVSMAKFSRVADRLSYIWAVMTFTSSFSLTSLPIITRNRILPMNTWNPYNWSAFPYYELTYAWQYMAQINMGMAYAATDSAYFCTSGLLGQQFQILGSNLRYCFQRGLLKFGLKKERVLAFMEDLKHEGLPQLKLQYTDVFSALESQEFRKINHEILAKNINHHQLLLRLCKEFRSVFKWTLLAKISATSFYIVFGVFTMTKAHGSSGIALMMYVCDASTQVFFFAFAGEILTQKAELHWVIYECPWYLCDLKWKSSFLMLQMKISEAVCVKAGDFFVMSAAFYVTFMKTIYSYITILRTMDEE